MVINFVPFKISINASIANWLTYLVEQGFQQITHVDIDMLRLESRRFGIVVTVSRLMTHALGIPS